MTIDYTNDDSVQRSQDLMLEIGKKYGTDKVSKHQYHTIYPLYLDKYRDTSGNMIEVGLNRSKSLKMYMELLPNMHIYALDINPFFNISALQEIEGFDLETMKSDRCTVIKCDQSSIDDLNDVKTKINLGIDIISDDGSHVPEHQVLTFNSLFPMLNSGGIYIIEDIETSYYNWATKKIYGRYNIKYGTGHPNSCIEQFKKVIEGINHKYANYYSPEIEHQHEIHSVTFALNCIIIIKK